MEKHSHIGVRTMYILNYSITMFCITYVVFYVTYFSNLCIYLLCISPCGKKKFMSPTKPFAFIQVLKHVIVHNLKFYIYLT